MTFREKLENAWQKSDSLLCIGLDPHPNYLPDGIRYSRSGVIKFNRAIIEATSDLVCAYKPNLAFYEAMGQEEGYGALRETLALIPPHIITIADGKRGDVDYTTKAYVTAIFDQLEFDCATVNPYLGPDTIKPWTELPSKGALVCCRTSNPGATTFQDLRVEGRGSRVFEVVAEEARELDHFGNVGLVTGATFPADIKTLRDLCPDMPFLVPGIGEQAGDLEKSVLAGLNTSGRGLLVSASRSVIFASSGADFPQSSRREATQLRDRIRAVSHHLTPVA